DPADLLARLLVLRGRHVATATLDGQLHLQLALGVQRGDVQRRVVHLDPGRRRDVGGGHLTRALLAQVHHDRLVLLGGNHQFLEVQDDVGDVFLHPGHGGELVQHALDPDAGHGGAGDGRQQGAAYRVPDRVAETRLQRLDDEPRPEVVDLLFSQSRTLGDEHWYPFPRRPLFDAAIFPGGRAVPSGPPLPRAPRNARPAPASLLLRVVLDDELFLYLRVDLGAGRQLVDEDPVPVRDDLHPGWGGPLARLGPGHHHRGQLDRPRPDLDDVVLGDPVGRNVHLLAVDREMTVPHQLAGHVPALGEAGPVHHVVQAAFQDLQQVLAGHPALAGGFLVVAVELPLENPVDPARLLLLPDLEQVLALLGPVAAVLTRGVGPELNRAFRRIALRALEEELHLLAAAQL